MKNFFVFLTLIIASTLWSCKKDSAVELKGSVDIRKPSVIGVVENLAFTKWKNRSSRRSNRITSHIKLSTGEMMGYISRRKYVNAMGLDRGDSPILTVFCASGETPCGILKLPETLNFKDIDNSVVRDYYTKLKTHKKVPVDLVTLSTVPIGKKDINASKLFLHSKHIGYSEFKTGSKWALFRTIRGKGGKLWSIIAVTHLTKFEFDNGTAELEFKVVLDKQKSQAWTRHL